MRKKPPENHTNNKVLIGSGGTRFETHPDDMGKPKPKPRPRFSDDVVQGGGAKADPNWGKYGSHVDNRGGVRLIKRGELKR